MTYGDELHDHVEPVGCVEFVDELHDVAVSQSTQQRHLVLDLLLSVATARLVDDLQRELELARSATST